MWDETGREIDAVEGLRLGERHGGARRLDDGNLVEERADEQG